MYRILVFLIFYRGPNFCSLNIFETIWSFVVLLQYIVYLQGFLMLLSDPSAHGSLETPVDVQGKATIKTEHNFEKPIICFMPCWL